MKYTNYGTHIKVKDINVSLKFYLSLGFKPIFAYGAPAHRKQLSRLGLDCVKEEYNGVIFQIGNAKFEIADGHRAVKSSVFKEDVPSSKVSAMIFLDSLDELLTLLTKNNIRISVPVKEYPWGTKELVVKDPDGFVLVFIQ